VKFLGGVYLGRRNICFDLWVISNSDLEVLPEMLSIFSTFTLCQSQSVNSSELGWLCPCMAEIHFVSEETNGILFLIVCSNQFS